MKRLILLLSIVLSHQVSIAEPLPKVHLDVNDKASLQNGAELFMEYCLSCHSLEFQRYNVTARDIGISSDDELKKKLIKTGSYSTRDEEYKESKVGELMYSAMSRKDSVLWFGTAPPDLSTIVRAKGANYIYSYLNTFYLDPTRPLGVNNIAFPGAGMPHVLIDLQGVYHPIEESRLPPKCEKEDDNDCKPVKVVVGTKMVEQGLMSESEYRKATNDIVNFLAYISEPAQIKRAQYGPWVIGFLIIFTILAYFLNREYWKDIK